MSSEKIVKLSETVLVKFFPSESGTDLKWRLLGQLDKMGLEKGNT